jgi:hypothetical protein
MTDLPQLPSISEEPVPIKVCTSPGCSQPRYLAYALCKDHHNAWRRARTSTASNTVNDIVEMKQGIAHLRLGLLETKAKYNADFVKLTQVMQAHIADYQANMLTFHLWIKEFQKMEREQARTFKLLGDVRDECLARIEKLEAFTSKAFFDAVEGTAGTKEHLLVELVKPGTPTVWTVAEDMRAKIETFKATLPAPQSPNRMPETMVNGNLALTVGPI